MYNETEFDSLYYKEEGRFNLFEKLNSGLVKSEEEEIVSEKELKKYRVIIKSTIDFEVEAKNAEQARDIAYNEDWSDLMNNSCLDEVYELKD